MAADINDKFTEATNGSRPVATTLTAILPSGASPGTATCGALTGWPTATAVHFVIYTVDVNGRKVSGSQTDWKGIVSGSTLTGLVLKAGTNNGYSIGAVVEAAPTAAWADDVTEGIMVGHTQLGHHKTLKDVNGNEILEFGETASAVNQLKATNAATGNQVELSATGDDANIGLKVTPKGTGDINLNGPVAFTEDVQNYIRSDNMLINGNFNVWQRATTAAPNDDTYRTADRWNFLTETNGAWTTARDTDAPVGSLSSMKFTNITLNNQCAIVQFIENTDSKPLDDGVVSLSFWAKTSGTEIANLRAGIITWAGTANSVTSDVFGTWASDGTNPTLAANWTYENTPSNLALTSSWQRFTIENVAIDTATVNNIAVVIWVDDGTIAANDDFWIAQVQLNQGSKAMRFQQRPIAQELMMCYRYYETYGYGQQACIAAATDMKILWPFKMEKRANPTITLLTTTPAMEETNIAARTGAASTIPSPLTTTHGATGNMGGFSGMTAGRFAHATADNIVSADGEL